MAHRATRVPGLRLAPSFDALGAGTGGCELGLPSHTVCFTYLLSPRAVYSALPAKPTPALVDGSRAHVRPLSEPSGSPAQGLFPRGIFHPLPDPFMQPEWSNGALIHSLVVRHVIEGPYPQMA